MKEANFDPHGSRKHCLVGKFFTVGSLPSIEETEKSVKQQWKLSGGVSVKPMEHNVILFDFQHEEEMKNVLESTPWIVNDITLVLKEWFDGKNVANIDFSATCFWVKFLGLPLSHYTEEKATRTAQLISNKILRLDLDPRTRYFWARVEINLKKPLQFGCMLRSSGCGDMFVQFKYHNLGRFCYRCGGIDHSERICNVIPLMRVSTLGKLMPIYGPWLDANLIPDHQIHIMLSEELSHAEDEESLPYSQFLIELNVYVVHVNFLWGTLADPVQKHRLWLPCSSLTATSDGGASSQAHEILSRALDENVPFPLDRVKVLSWPAESMPGDKTDTIQSLVDYLQYVKNHRRYSHWKWLPLRLDIRKSVPLCDVDFESMFQDRRDDAYEDLIEKTISDLIVREAAGDEDLSSLSLWMRKIQEALARIGVTELTFDLEERAELAMAAAISERELSVSCCPKPADDLD